MTQQTMEEARRAVDDATAYHRTRIIGENILQNLKWWTRKNAAPVEHVSRHYVHNDGGFYPVVIAGAGSSLDNTRKFLHGPVSLATNSAAVALASTGHRTSMCVSIEALPMHKHWGKLPGHVGVFALDWSSHPQTVKWVEKRYKHNYCIFWDSAPHSMVATMETGCSAVSYGSSAMTAAIEIALSSFGSTVTTLIGCDLGHSGPNPYAKGAPWQKLRWKKSGDKLKFTGALERDALHWTNGVASIPRNRTYWDVPAVRGGTVPSTQELIDQRDWVANRIRKHKGSFNNISDGASIAGARELQPDVLRGIAAVKGVPGYREAIDMKPIVAALLEQAARAKRLTGHMLRDEPKDFNVECLTGGNPFVILMATRGMLELKRAKAKPVDKFYGTYEAIEEAADRIIKVLG